LSTERGGTAAALGIDRAVHPHSIRSSKTAQQLPIIPSGLIGLPETGDRRGGGEANCRPDSQLLPVRFQGAFRSVELTSTHLDNISGDDAGGHQSALGRSW
jgi:hypothetical protein